MLIFTNETQHPEWTIEKWNFSWAMWKFYVFNQGRSSDCKEKLLYKLVDFIFNSRNSMKTRSGLCVHWFISNTWAIQHYSDAIYNSAQFIMFIWYQIASFIPSKTGAEPLQRNTKSTVRFLFGAHTCTERMKTWMHDAQWC